MKTVTVKEFMKLRPLCYSKKQIKKIAGAKKEWTALEDEV